MSAHPPFDPGTIEAIARVLGEAGTGTDISRYFEICRLIDNSGESTKWRRLNAVFLKSQTANSSNQILAFIKSYLAPTRFVGARDRFETHRSELNAILILHGFEYGKDGEFRPITQAKLWMRPNCALRASAKNLPHATRIMKCTNTAKPN